MMFDCRTPIMPLICTNSVVGIITQPESSISSEKVAFAGPSKVAFAGPSVVVPLPITTSIAAAQVPTSPQSHVRSSPMVKGKSAIVIAPSEAQNDGSQSTATFFTPPVNHPSDFVGVCMRSFFILSEGALLISSDSDWFYPSL